jgi:hypothetical protein
MVDLVSILAAAVIIILLLVIIGMVIRWGFRIIWYLLANAIVGIIILGVANLIGIGVPIDWITVAISAIAGIPGALVVIFLYLIGTVL